MAAPRALFSEIERVRNSCSPSRYTASMSVLARRACIARAIGWALREHAKTDPEAVYRYVVRKSDVLSGLSKREALKNTDYAIP